MIVFKISFQTADEWKYVALVIDRIFLIIYIAVCLFGSLGLLMNAPALYDDREPVVIGL